MYHMPSIDCAPYPATRRSGFSLPALLGALAVVGLLVVAGWYAVPRLFVSSDDSDGPLLQSVERKLFIHDVTERGNVESANNVEIVSKVKSNNSSGTTILEIVDEGYVITEEDVENKKVVSDLSFPLAMIESGDPQWYSLEVPETKVPKQFYIALSFDPRSTTGIYLAAAEEAEPSTQPTDSSSGALGSQEDALKGSVKVVFKAMASVMENDAEMPFDVDEMPAEGDVTPTASDEGELAEETAKSDPIEKYAEPKGMIELTYLDHSTDVESVSPTRQALQFKRPVGVRAVTTVRVYAGRRSSPSADQDFHVYLLVDDAKVLVKLDDSSLDNQRLQQQIVFESSRASVIQAQSVLETAIISKQEYLEGTLQEQLKKIEIDGEEAAVALTQAQQLLKFSERLYRKGYVTPVQLEEEKIKVMKAKNLLELAEQKRNVLLEYTKKKEKKQFEANIKTAEAKLKAELASHLLDKEKLDLIEEQIVNCTIRAPERGQVVYANHEGHHGRGEIVIEEGTVIRERQAIVRLPDRSQMQVVAKINEGKISMVKIGMRARIRPDAFPDLVLDGIVEEVSEYPAATGWMGSAVKEYETTIKILDPPDDLRSGYNAEVKIRVEQLRDALQVPVQAIIEHGNKLYCVLPDGKGVKKRQVTMSTTNDKTVVITGGLKEGERIVLNAAAYRDDIDLPKLVPEEADQPVQEVAGEAPQPGQRNQPGQRTQPGQKMPPGEKRPSGRPKGRPGMAQVMSWMDKNGDGKIDQDELEKLPAPMREGLAKADKNQDGTIDRGELAAGMAEMRPPKRAPGATPETRP